MYYKRRRYVCSCGKRFSEKTSFIERDQRFSKEWHQAIQMLCVKSPTFKSVAEKMGTASSTVIRRFDQVAEQQLVSGVTLPKAIAIEEYKGDTDAGKYQLIIVSSFRWSYSHGLLEWRTHKNVFKRNVCEFT
ncbi:helix-turn-helix domain-containing protein [Kurthia sibirica]|uniref:Transposase IS204/IS1001/IS1096/IS1165 helix-turn-helix domain-containing protein n=1 Tax=Kurthia sibirica TaxID=202750 RepID=A0A2U3ALZ8_9BACL|nr:helix-turn-helix domain-containing protein [Kurthia sibirica]PWI25568.1 hypothetical protein DEX24_08150 [Kurthia sibirica]